MFEKLAAIEFRFVEIEDALMQGNLDGKELTKLTKEHAEIEEVVGLYRQLTALDQEIYSLKELQQGPDEDLKALAKEELPIALEQKDTLTQELTLLMLPKDPYDKKNVVLEVRAGTGGDEAGIFCGDLLRMYLRYAESKRWKVEILSQTEAAKGGFKEVTYLISGDSVYSRFKFEKGVHRVQRVPTTESQGRIHTSACTVAILPEADEVEISVNPADLRIDTYRASGSGGQHVNTTDSAVRITHVPTGVVAECQDERSQHKNKDKAMKMLRSRLLEAQQAEQAEEISSDRKLQVGSGDRSERIRTYNFPQGRMTDHRINLTLYKLDEIMSGKLDEILDALGTHHTAELLKHQRDA